MVGGTSDESRSSCYADFSVTCGIAQVYTVLSAFWWLLLLLLVYVNIVWHVFPSVL